MNLKIAICEDEVLVGNMLSEYLSELGHDISVLAFEPEEFLNHIRSLPVDLAFLDINLESDMTGIDVAEQLVQMNIPMIFVTAYSDSNTLENALNQKPLAYLVKPFTKEQLKAQLELVKLQLGQNYIEIHVHRNVYRINTNELIFFESDRNYTIFHMTDQELKIRGTLKNFIKLFPENRFISTHRSFVINKDHLIKYDKETCLMTGHQQVPVGRHHREELDVKLQ